MPTQIIETEASLDEQGLLQSKHAGDRLPFERLAQQYNFHNVSAFTLVLTNLILQEVFARRPSPRVLDIGCGRGIGRRQAYQRVLRDAGCELWGIEPDPSVDPPIGLFDHFQTATLESAELPAKQFDVAYSCMVMEHVENPKRFLDSLAACLKPGGVYLFATPNARSFVPFASKLLHTVGMDELILRLLRGSKGDEYHFPVQFKFNTPRSVRAALDGTQFGPPEFVFTESDGGVGGYFPGPLRPMKWLLERKRRLVKHPDRLITLFGRLTKNDSHDAGR